MQKEKAKVYTYTGDNLYWFRVLETDQLFQVSIPVLEFM